MENILWKWTFVLDVKIVDRNIMHFMKSVHRNEKEKRPQMKENK